MLIMSVLSATLLLLVGCDQQRLRVAERIFASTSPSVVKVYGLSSSGVGGNRAGTGFAVVVDGKPVIVTNQHIVEKAEVVVVESSSGIWSTPDWREHPSQDIALLTVPPTVSLPTLGTGSASRVSPGKRVYTVGHPLGEVLAIQEGIVSSVEGPSMVFSAPLSTGASGSPLLDEDGSVIGLCHSFVPNAQNYNLALPIDFISLPAQWESHQASQDPSLAGYLEKVGGVKASARRSLSSWESVVREFPEWERWVMESNLTRRPLVSAMESAVSTARAIDWGVELSASLRSTETSGDHPLSALLRKNASELSEAWTMHTANVERLENLRPISTEWWALSDHTLVPDLVSSLRAMADSLEKLALPSESASPEATEAYAPVSASLSRQSELEERWSRGLVP
jgi:hypothetical protein